MLVGGKRETTMLHGRIPTNLGGNNPSSLQTNHLLAVFVCDLEELHHFVAGDNLHQTNKEALHKSFVDVKSLPLPRIAFRRLRLNLLFLFVSPPFSADGKYDDEAL